MLAITAYLFIAPTIKSHVSLLPILHRYLPLISKLPLSVPTKPINKSKPVKAMSNTEMLTRSDSVVKKRVRHELDELVLDSPEVKRLRDDLFDDSSHDSPIQDLDSLMKSFEDELSTTTTAQGSGETLPDLGYLFEASDDELGLPPPPPPSSTLLPPSYEETEKTAAELVRASSDSSGVGELCGFDERVTGFGSFELDDGLFEYSDVCLDSGDLFSWRPETLPAE